MIISLGDLRSFFNVPAGIKGRILGLDLGSKIVGVALSDTRWKIASPLTTLARRPFHKALSDLQALLDTHQGVGLILGWPLNMDGRPGPGCQSVEAFAHQLLQSMDLPIVFWDERLSTVASERSLLLHDLSRKRRAEIIDKVAASYILQGALDCLWGANLRERELP